MPNGNDRVAIEIPRTIIRAGIDLSAIVRARDPDPIDVIRATDLVHLRCSFVNLRIDRRGNEPRLVRRAANRPAFLVMEWAPQHVVEQAFYESADDITPIDETLAAQEKAEQAKLGGAATNPPLKPPPVIASMAGSSRVVFKVTDERIVFTVAGLLDAASRLPMSVAPHASPPPAPNFGWTATEFVGSMTTASSFIESVLGGGARLPASRRTGVESSAGARFARAGRAAATTSTLLARFGAETAGAFVASSALTVERAIKPINVGLIELGRLAALRQPPRAPHSNETSIELPWRLVVSPSTKGGWAHSASAVDHDGRVELWHSRLGVRRDSPDIEVDERSAYYRTIRAIWARDFDELAPKFGFDPKAGPGSFPNADGDDDRPPFRMSLNSRDRMMLVHQTSNFTMRTSPQSRTGWTPPAVPVNRLMLTSQGAWLNSRVQFATRPGGTGLTLEEWKHIATLGRDHEVKVVYAGFLMPFGHRASLVKVSQRKFGSGIEGDPAYVYQRMFIIVREPVRQFRTSQQIDEHDHRLDLGMPFTSVRILTEITPDIDRPDNLFASGGYMFPVEVGNRPFGFKTVAADMEGNVADFDAPMYFVEADQNESAGNEVRSKYNGGDVVARRIDVGGQRIAFARGAKPDDTVVSVQTLLFDAVGNDSIDGRPNTQPHWEPKLAVAGARVPAAQALSGADTVTELTYPDTYLKNEFVGGEVFLRTVENSTPTRLDFSGHGDRSGGFLTPSIEISGLSRLTGPIGGSIDVAESGQFDPTEFFKGIPAKLFGIVSLADVIPSSVFDELKVPKFVAQSVNVATTLVSNAERLRDFATRVQQGSVTPALATAAGEVQTAVDDLVAALDGLGAPGAVAPVAELNVLSARIQTFGDAALAATDVVDETFAKQIGAIGRLLTEQLANTGAIAAAAEALRMFAQGMKLPETVSARLDWSTGLQKWPATNSIFVPGPDGDPRFTLAVEIQAPVTSTGDPNILVSCSLPAVDLKLIGDDPFLILHFQKMRFTLEPGKKPDVDIVFDPAKGIEFAGPLEFVETLKDIIPLDGFSDPPYLDVSADGVEAGFDLALPNLAVGVFSLENISLGAHVLVPFIGESLEVGFNFCSRENPFRLTVSLFGGGGFFGITLTPAEVRVLELALEFGAAISVNFGVASGGVEVMAGIYIRIENDDATLTGYFRLRGEVDVLGLISASIELYMELTYETATKKAIGRATITVEVEVLFFSASVKISTEKKFAGANNDPTFADVMGLAPGAPPGTERPWDLYCGAFA